MIQLIIDLQEDEPGNGNYFGVHDFVSSGDDHHHHHEQRNHVKVACADIELGNTFNDPQDNDNDADNEFDVATSGATGATTGINTKKLITARNVTTLGDLLDFGQLFKASGRNYFAQIAHIFRQFLKVSKSFIFRVESFWATFIDIWQLFTGHTDCKQTNDVTFSCLSSLELPYLAIL